MAVAEYKKLTWSERRRLITEEKEKARQDKAAMLHYAWNEGRLEGEAIGETRGRIESKTRGQSMEREQILGLLDQGMSLDVVFREDAVRMSRGHGTDGEKTDDRSEETVHRRHES